jgi:hypothetical protein
MFNQPASTNKVPPADQACFQEMRELACWWSEVGASSDCPSLELKKRLLELRPGLSKYLASQAERANPLLLADLDQLIVRLGNCLPSQVCWINLSHAIGLFFSQLQKLNGASSAA